MKIDYDKEIEYQRRLLEAEKSSNQQNRILNRIRGLKILRGWAMTIEGDKNCHLENKNNKI